MNDNYWNSYERHSISDHGDHMEADVKKRVDRDTEPERSRDVKEQPRYSGTAPYDRGKQHVGTRVPATLGTKDQVLMTLPKQHHDIEWPHEQREGNRDAEALRNELERARRENAELQRRLTLRDDAMSDGRIELLEGERGTSPVHRRIEDVDDEDAMTRSIQCSEPAPEHPFSTAPIFWDPTGEPMAGNFGRVEDLTMATSLDYVVPPGYGATSGRDAIKPASRASVASFDVLSGSRTPASARSEVSVGMPGNEAEARVPHARSVAENLMKLAEQVRQRENLTCTMKNELDEQKKLTLEQGRRIQELTEQLNRLQREKSSGIGQGQRVDPHALDPEAVDFEMKELAKKVRLLTSANKELKDRYKVLEDEHVHHSAEMRVENGTLKFRLAAKEKELAEIKTGGAPTGEMEKLKAELHRQKQERQQAETVAEQLRTKSNELHRKVAELERQVSMSRPAGGASGAVDQRQLAALEAALRQKQIDFERIHDDWTRANDMKLDLERQITLLRADNNKYKDVIGQRQMAEMRAPAATRYSPPPTQAAAAPPRSTPAPAVETRTFARTAAPPAASLTSDWSCGACTYINAAKDVACEMCGTLAPGRSTFNPGGTQLGELEID